MTIPALTAAPGQHRADVPLDSPPATDVPARYRGLRRRTLLDVAVARVTAAVDSVTAQDCACEIGYECLACARRRIARRASS